ncbi:MAG: Rhamnulokinase [candidate division TA06 bacterium ADurb.Bin417]|uniref:Rhamnulokinase n=1 Tax=candidate division TA06 bacterium ADurb.Bin417 TaxID=1852828 RepID=A0A1V5MAY1_UNCT6|nr:MAG: Rhamnulokinase [candidate division TA06 bacterium ADurb.Bin417]
MAACPARPGERFAYLSSGTWSLLGVELDRPLINEKTRAEGFTNEGGIGGTYRFLHNITGLWILQECRRAWQRKGTLYEYPELTRLAAEARPFQAVINPDHPDFLAPEDMPAAVAGFCRKTGQRPPRDRGGLVRIILESLALRYGQFIGMLNRLGALPGPLELLYVVGGGSQNELLNQFTANATGIPVMTGPVEATAAGNILAQALAAGEIGSVWEGRAAIRASHDLKTYRPADRERWTEMLNQMEKVCSMA